MAWRVARTLVVLLVCAPAALAPHGARGEDGTGPVSRFLAFMTDPGELSRAHEPVDGNCSACHTAFKGQEAGKCVACHANESMLLARQPTAFHASIDRCGGCHIEHRGRNARPTAMSHLALAAALARGDDSPLGAALRGKPEAELERSLDCNRCHANQDPHRQQFGTGCADCHTTARWQIEGYRHPSPESRDCAQCHVAPPSHYMMHFEMVSEKTVGLEHVEVRSCYLCHETTAWNDIRGVGWYKHH